MRLLLVAGLIAPATEWNPIAATLANRLRRAYGASRQRCGGFSQPRIGQEQPPRRYSRRWPRRFRNTPARQRVVVGRRFHTFRHPRPQHRFIHHAGIDALQPIIPPTQDFLEESDLGTGKRKVRIGVPPWPDETLAGHLQSLEKARDCILITIGPTADGIDRALDRRVVLAYRSVLPIPIASLVPQPIVLEQWYALQALQPHRSPAIADQRGIGRQAHQAEKEKGPLKSGGGKKRAAHVVRVVGVPIVSYAGEIVTIALSAGGRRAAI